MCQCLCITKASFWMFLSSPVVGKMVRWFFRAGLVLAGAPGPGASASQVQHTHLVNFPTEILGTLSSWLSIRTVTFQKNRFFWVILAGILLIHLFTSLTWICLGLDPKPRQDRESSWVDPLHQVWEAQKSMDSHKWGYGVEMGWAASQRQPLVWWPQAAPLPPDAEVVFPHLISQERPNSWGISSIVQVHQGWPYTLKGSSAF